MTSTLYVPLFCWIAMQYRVTCQCSGTPKNVPVGYSSVLIRPPSNFSVDGNSTVKCEWIASSTLNATSLLYRVTNTKLNCTDGWINIYEGTNESTIDEQIRFTEVCSQDGTTTERHYDAVSSGNVFVSFTSTNPTTVTDMGFEIHLISATGFTKTPNGCNGTESLIATYDSQYLSIFPNEYSKSLKECSWEIAADDHTANVVINIKFLDLDIYHSDVNVTYNYLEINESEQTIAQLFRGDVDDVWNPNRTYRSHGYNFTLTLYLDNATVNRGLLLSYTQADKPLTTWTEGQAAISTSYDETSTQTEPVHEATSTKETTTTEGNTVTIATATASTPSSPLPSSRNDGDGDNNREIGGIVVGSLLAILIVTIIILICRNRAPTFAIFNVTTYSKHKDEVTLEDNNSKTGNDNPAVVDEEAQTQKGDKEADRNDVSATQDANCVNVDETTDKLDKEDPSIATDESKTYTNGSPGEQGKILGAKDGDLIKLDDGKATNESTPLSSPDISSDKQEPSITLDANDTKSDGLLAAIDDEISNKEDDLITLENKDTNKANESALSDNDDANIGKISKAMEEGVKDEIKFEPKGDNVGNATTTQDDNGVILIN